jgi:hypothetical protein
MSKNLAQVFATNPITTIGSSDILYVSQSGTTDAGISGASLNALYPSKTLASGNILVGSAGNVATSVTMSGDATIIASGAITVGSIGGKVVSLANSFTTSGNFAVTQTYTGVTNVTFPTTGTLATTSQIPSVSPAALTKTDDTNITLTLGGTPATSLLQATSITAGWTGTLGVDRGGIGSGSATAYAVLCGGTTSTGALQSVASVGTAGHVLTSNGAGALPTFQAAGGGGLSQQQVMSINSMGV